MSTVNISEVIVALEHQTWKALQSSGDALLPFLSPGCIMMFPMGLKVSATSSPTLKDILTSEAFVPWTTYQMSDVSVMQLGNEGAVVAYKVEATRPGIADPDDEESSDEDDENFTVFRALISSVWRRDADSGGWLMSLHQQTPYEIEV